MILPGTKKLDSSGGYACDVECQQCQKCQRVAFGGWSKLSCPCGAEIERGPHYRTRAKRPDSRRRIGGLHASPAEEARLMELAKWLGCSRSEAIRAAVDAALSLYREKGTK